MVHPTAHGRARPRVLVVEDDRALLEVLQDAFEGEGMDATLTPDPEEGLRVAREREIDCILLDMGLPRMHGTEFLRQLRSRDTRTQVIVLSGNRDLESLRQARALGAWSYLTKPINLTGLMGAIRTAIENGEEREKPAEEPLSDRILMQWKEGSPLMVSPEGAETLVLSVTPDPVSPLEDVGTLRYRGTAIQAPAMVQLLRKSQRAAHSFTELLVTGASGSGRTSLAHLVFEQAGVPASRILRLGCRTLDPARITSELRRAREEMFAGVLLDHVDALDVRCQEILSEWLDELEACRGLAGAGLPRVISIAGHDLPGGNRSLLFDAGLYYRLSRIELPVPDLAMRRKDILILARHFLERSTSPIPAARRDLSLRTCACFLSYPWPGNVIELRGAVDTAMASTSSGMIEIEDLPRRLTHYYEEHKAEINREVIHVFKT